MSTVERPNGRSSNALDSSNEFELSQLHSRKSERKSAENEINAVEESSTQQEASTSDAAATTDEEAAAAKLNKSQLTILAIALALSVFLIALDESIIATAIPRITDRFHSLSDVAWYGSAYLLTMCCFQLSYGKLYQHFPDKNIFLGAIAIFELGSLVCATSPSSAALIVGRILSGSGASGIISGCLIMISKAVPLRQRALFTGAVGSIYSIAAVGGPLIGGVITDSYLTWRWCFYINLPCGGFVAAVIILFYKPPKRRETDDKTVMQKLKELDPLGLMLFIPAMVCLILALQFSGEDASWGTARVVVCIVMFAVLLVAFAGVQIWLQEGATLPPRIAKQRTVFFVSLFELCLDGSNYMFLYFLPIWFQVVQGASASQSGIRILPLIIGAFATALLAGLLVSKTGRYAEWVIAASILSAIGAGLLTTLNPSTSTGKWIGYQILVGVGVGAGMQQGAIIVQNVLSTEGDIAIAISAVAFFQVLGPTIMISVAQAVFDQRLYANLKRLIPDLDPGTLFTTGATQLTSLVGSQDHDAVVEGVNNALTQTWYGAVAIAALSGVGAFGMEWKKLKKE